MGYRSASISVLASTLTLVLKLMRPLLLVLGPRLAAGLEGKPWQARAPASVQAVAAMPVPVPVPESVAMWLFLEAQPRAPAQEDTPAAVLMPVPELVAMPLFLEAQRSAVASGVKLMPALAVASQEALELVAVSLWALRSVLE